MCIHKRVPAVAVLISLAVATAAVRLRGAEADHGSLVIVYKDGHRQTVRLSEVTRIEFNTPAEITKGPGASRFQGEWKVGVGDGSDRTFLIRLKPDGVAHKTYGSSSGTWTAVNGEARITWEDGWRDVIRKAGNKYQKAAYSPGHAFSGDPANVTEAVYTEAH